jgi:uncharacterized protein
MPANLTPQYFEAEKRFKEATTTEEKILAIERMLAVIPKHKGTDHMRAELRRKISKLKEDTAGHTSSKGRQADIFYIPKTGAAQIALLGTPNSGKSSIVAALTNAKVVVADFPFSTGIPVPGMVHFEDIRMQIIDMPPITADYSAPGQIGAYRNCDLITIVIDLSADIAGQLTICLDFLDSKGLLAGQETPAPDSNDNRKNKHVFYLGTKADIAAPDALDVIKQTSPYQFDICAVSARTGQAIDSLPALLFKQARLIRVYTKPPGKKADLNSPFTLPAGSTVFDLASTIHREFVDKFKSARIWGRGVHDGQNVQRTHILNDKDIVELYFG